MLLGDVWSVFHALSVRHVRCPYDGALIHADELGKAEQGSQERVAEGPLPAANVVHHHRACASFTAVQRAAFLAAVARAGEFCELAPALLPEFAQVSVGGLSVLAYAPKQSPPV
jgi:hypothetical protein